MSCFGYCFGLSTGFNKGQRPPAINRGRESPKTFIVVNKHQLLPDQKPLHDKNETRQRLRMSHLHGGRWRTAAAGCDPAYKYLPSSCDCSHTRWGLWRHRCSPQSNVTIWTSENRLANIFLPPALAGDCDSTIYRCSPIHSTILLITSPLSHQQQGR